MKKFKHFLASALLLSALVAPSMGSVKAASATDVNDYIYGLNYQADQLLAQNGEKLTNIVPTSSKLDNGTFTVVKREKRALATILPIYQ